MLTFLLYPAFVFFRIGSQFQVRRFSAIAVALWSSSAMLNSKVIMLPLILVLLAMAAGVSSSEDGPVAKSGGRFSETPMGRKLLNLQLCGSGSAPNYNCAAILPFANKPTCCTDSLGNKACWDVGSIWLDKCGSCNTKCPFGSICCSGVCANLLNDKNNCRWCKRQCPGGLSCQWGLCGYN